MFDTFSVSGTPVSLPVYLLWKIKVSGHIKKMSSKARVYISPCVHQFVSDTNLMHVLETYNKAICVFIPNYVCFDQALQFTDAKIFYHHGSFDRYFFQTHVCF